MNQLLAIASILKTKLRVSLIRSFIFISTIERGKSSRVMVIHVTNNIN